MFSSSSSSSSFSSSSSSRPAGSWYAVIFCLIHTTPTQTYLRLEFGAEKISVFSRVEINLLKLTSYFRSLFFIQQSFAFYVTRTVAHSLAFSPVLSPLSSHHSTARMNALSLSLLTWRWWPYDCWERILLWVAGSNQSCQLHQTFWDAHFLALSLVYGVLYFYFYCQ
jgi:hypothetical protein